MNDATPRYLLMAQASRAEGFGHWRFVFRPVDGSEGVEVADVEPNVWGERLDLLTVVRALESLDQPSSVTLIGCTRYVEQGIQFGLEEWRENDWKWEFFGQMAPVRDSDLWQRMDRVLEFHRVECGQRRFDSGHDPLGGHHWNKTEAGGKWADRIAGVDWLTYSVPAMVAWCGAWMQMTSRYWQMAVRVVAFLGSSLLVHRS